MRGTLTPGGRWRPELDRSGAALIGLPGDRWPQAGGISSSGGRYLAHQVALYLRIRAQCDS
jgi:hypothetical protein